MANNPHFYGIRYHHSRMYPSPTPERVFVASGYQASVSPGPVACDICVGDPVVKVSDGTVAIASGTSAIYGIVTNILPFRDSVTGALRIGKQLPGGTTFTAQNQATQVEILPWANVVFEIDVDDNVTATTEAAYKLFIGENANIVFSPDATNRRANPLLDISTHAVTATLPARIVDLAPIPTQDYSGTFVKLLITGNLAQQAPYTALGV